LISGDDDQLLLVDAGRESVDVTRQPAENESIRFEPRERSAFPVADEQNGAPPGGRRDRADAIAQQLDLPRA